MQSLGKWDDPDRDFSSKVGKDERKQGMEWKKPEQSQLCFQ